MNLNEILDRIKNLGKDFRFHKIFFPEKINRAFALGYIFDNPKVSELITRTEISENIKSKLDLCVELVRNVALKRLVLSNNYFEDIKTAIQCGLMVYFDMVDASPLKGILSVRQEEIGKGNYLILEIDYEVLKEPIVALLAILLAEKLREIINASPYSVADKKQIKEILLRKFPSLEPTIQYLMTDFSRYLLDKIFIKVMDEKRVDITVLDIFLDSLFLYYNETFKILDIIDQDRFLRKIISKHYMLLKKVAIKNVGKNSILLLSNSSASFGNIEQLSNCTAYEAIPKILEIESLRVKIPTLSKVENNEIKEKLGIILKEESTEEENQIILPKAFKDKFAQTTNIEIYSFVCEDCLKTGYSDYCADCRRFMRLSYYCEKCGISNQERICISCNSVLSPIGKFSINISNEIAKKLFEISLGPEYIQRINYVDTKYIEPLEKSAIKVKHRVKISENGIAEVRVRVIPADEFDIGDSRIELNEDEIILPFSILEIIDKIIPYLEDIVAQYDLADIERKSIEEGDLLFIRNSRGLIYYPVRIKKVVDTNYAFISSKLFNRIFGNILVNNEAKICLPLDFLLNASARLIDGEKAAYFLIMAPEMKEDEEKPKKIIITRETEENDKILAFNFKNNFMNEYARLIETNIGLQIRCPKCDNLMQRPKIHLFCNKCGARLTYRWIKKEVNDASKEYNEYLKNSTLQPIYKFNSRKLKKLVYRFFKEEEKFERLDKFFNV